MKIEDIDYSGLPEHMRNGAKLYIESGILPGSFMTAIISNDLATACATADSINKERIYEICSWFYLMAPSDCYGSSDKMNAWIQKKRLERKEKFTS